MLQEDKDRLDSAFRRQKAAAAADPFPSLEARRATLEQLLALTEDHEREICAAIDADFGGRSHHETRVAELMVVRAGIRHALSKLSSWMASRRVPTSMPFWPARNRLIRQPLGVVGIVSPWNYPFQLAVAPATAALAAGNRVLLKPSETTPRFSELLADLVARHFAPDDISVVTGDAEVGRAFVSLPFDHLLFTGSTAVGRKVALAAAANLTPVTLELGGKSPAILDSSCDIERAAASIAYGKLLNAGQTCIAPDYLLVPKGRGAEAAERIAAHAARLYPRLGDNPDYTAIATDRHFARLRNMVDDARSDGAEIVEVNPSGEDEATLGRKFKPTIVLNAATQSALLNEEIFGPVLPVVEYADVDAAISYINERERPLALYWFGKDRSVRSRFLQETIAGGVTINDCLMHIAQEEQPFGGVGASGTGAYHGEWGFRNFSKEKPVFIQSALNGGRFLQPPYGAMFERVMSMVRRIT